MEGNVSANKKQNRKIAFVLGSMGQGGAEKVISVLSRDYAEKGWDTDIIVLLDNRVEYDLHPSTRIIDFSGSKQSRIKRLPYWILSLRNYAKTNKPDVLLSFAARINIIVHIACRKIVPRLFVSERNDPCHDGRSGIVDRMTKYLYPKTDGVIFQTERAKVYFENLENGCIIPNPISVSTYAKLEKKKTIVSVGSLKPQKNQKLLIDAFACIAAEFPEHQLVIYGEGMLREALEQQIAEFNLQERVLLPGGKRNIHECIADAELFVLSSDYEGLSNALLEALMMGLPCISTNSAGADEYIDGSNGLVVPVADKAALAEAMRKMLLDDNFRKQCGVNAASKSAEFNTKSVLNKWHELMG